MMPLSTSTASGKGLSIPETALQPTLYQSGITNAGFVGRSPGMDGVSDSATSGVAISSTFSFGGLSASASVTVKVGTAGPSFPDTTGTPRRIARMSAK